MKTWLKLARAIDTINEAIGAAVSWALLLAVLICSANALVRYTLNASSNSWLEIQWYLFAGIFLLAAPVTLKRNEHVRIDVMVGRFTRRTQVWIDVFGLIFFLFPVTLLMLTYALPYALQSIANQEVSSNAGGLIVWPAKALIPIGFTLLTLQGVAELIKRIGYLRGVVDASEFSKSSSNSEAEIAALQGAIREPEANQTSHSTPP